MAGTEEVPRGNRRRGRDLFHRFAPALRALSAGLRYLPRIIRTSLLRRARHASGRLAIGWRYALLQALDVTHGPNVSVREGVHLLGLDSLVLGENVSIHPMAYLDATGGLTVGNDVSIAHAATILSSTHTFDSLDVPIKDQKVVLRSTQIGDGCWVGAQAVILGGVTVGKGSIVAANAVVTADVPPFSVVAGSPARVVKVRT